MQMRSAAAIKFVALAFLVVACTQLHSAPSKAAAAPAQATQPAAPLMLLPAGAAVRDELIDAPGKSTVLTRCGTCHHPNIVATMHHDEDTWRELVGQMIARGAQVPDEEYDGLIAYLSKNYAEKQP